MASQRVWKQREHIILQETRRLYSFSILQTTLTGFAERKNRERACHALKIRLAELQEWLVCKHA